MELLHCTDFPTVFTFPHIRIYHPDSLVLLCDMKSKSCLLLNMDIPGCLHQARLGLAEAFKQKGFGFEYLLGQLILWFDGFQLGNHQISLSFRLDNTMFPN